MTRLPDIWSRLQQYEVSPPGQLFDKVCARVKEEGSMGSIRRLEEHAIEPPEALRRSVEDAIFKKGPGRPGKGSRPVGLLVIRAAAACLVLGLAGWLIYRATLPRKTSVPAMSKNVTRLSSGSDTSKSLSGSDSLSKTDSLSSGNLLAGTPMDDSPAVVKTGRYHQPLSFHINGQPFPLVDNDLLVSWANFNYTELPGFIKGAGSETWKIHVDQYTNIFVSKTMSEMMKEMGQRRANGNPTRRARKSREKLNKWKKADAAQFDRSVPKNPMDPIDLAEFIFK